MSFSSYNKHKMRQSAFLQWWQIVTVISRVLHNKLRLKAFVESLVRDCNSHNTSRLHNINIHLLNHTKLNYSNHSYLHTASSEKQSTFHNVIPCKSWTLDQVHTHCGNIHSGLPQNCEWPPDKPSCCLWCQHKCRSRAQHIVGKQSWSSETRKHRKKWKF